MFYDIMENTLKVLIVTLLIFIGMFISEWGLAEDMEYAYFEWQKDAINQDIRIDLDRCEWIKNPWDNVRKSPDYIPTRLECND